MSNQNWQPGQPLPLDITEINPYKKQTYSEFANGGGYEVKSGFRPIDPADFGMARTIKNMMINALPVQYEKVRLKLDEQYNNTLRTIEADIQSELVASGLSVEGAHQTIQTISRDKSIVTHFTQNRNAQLLTSQQQANNFSGTDPLALTHPQLLSVTRSRFGTDPGQFEKSAAHQLKTYANSARAAYTARLLTTAIQILNNRSNILDANLAGAHAQERARIAVQQEAQRRAQIAAQQEAQRQAQVAAQKEAQRQAQIAHAREQAQLLAKQQADARIAATQAERQKKQQTANELADRFDAQLKKLAHNQPQDIDEKLRWMREKYQKLYAAHLKAAEAERKVGGFYNFPRNSKRWGALNKAQHNIEALVRTKHGIENVMLATASGAIASARPLVITPDGLIAGYEGAPFSVIGASESLSNLRTLAGGPVAAFFASVLYTPTLGNGELQRNPVVVTIPLSQFGKDKAYTPIRHKGKAETDWLPYRVVASVQGEHTQLYFTPSGNSPFVQVRLVTLDPKTNLYTFTTEGLLPRTLTWTPNHAPGNDSLGSTELPVAQSDIKIYPGARVTQIEGRTDEHPMCDQADIDDYILEFPIESGIEPVYVMVSRSGPRYEPGTATGMGQPVGGNWLGSAGDAGGSPIPAQIADQLRAQDFRSFDRFRESFWKAIAADESLRRQFGKVDLEQMTNGAAPYAEPLDSVGGREKIEIHHKQRITDGGAVYDLENLSILTPKAHIELHKKGTPQ
jgi:hypothetical protein